MQTVGLLNEFDVCVLLGITLGELAAFRKADHFPPPDAVYGAKPLWVNHRIFNIMAVIDEAFDRSVKQEDNVLMAFEWPHAFRRESQAIRWTRESGVIAAGPVLKERDGSIVVQVNTIKPVTVGRWLHRQTPGEVWILVPGA